MKENVFQKKYLIVFVSIFALIGTIIIANRFIYSNVVYAGELSDITNHWAQSDIEFMQAKGAISGYSDGTFKPDNNVTTGEAIKLIVANFDKTITNGIDHWASNYFKYAKENSLVKNDQYTINDLNTNITRKEVMYIVINSLEKLAYKPVIKNDDVKINFRDASITINEKGIDYYDAIKKCYLLGIVIGDENNNINPNANITRAELVTILTRAYNEERRQYDLSYKTDNLPTNSENYYKILKIMPNSFYEHGNTTYAKYKNNGTPYYYFSELLYRFEDEEIERIKTNMDTALSALLNVSYDMSEEEWIEWTSAVIRFSDVYDEYFEKVESKIEDYKEYVIENKITIRGGVIMEPLTFGNMKGENSQYKLSVKGLVNYKVVSNPNNVRKLTLGDYINNQTSIYKNDNIKYLLIEIENKSQSEFIDNIIFKTDNISYIKEG